MFRQVAIQPSSQRQTQNPGSYCTPGPVYCPALVRILRLDTSSNASSRVKLTHFLSSAEKKLCIGNANNGTFLFNPLKSLLYVHLFSLPCLTSRRHFSHHCGLVCRRNAHPYSDWMTLLLIPVPGWPIRAQLLWLRFQIIVD